MAIASGQKRRASWSMATDAKLQKLDYGKPALRLDCRVAPHRPQPQLMYAPKPWTTPCRPPTKIAGLYKVSAFTCPRSPQAADMRKKPLKSPKHTDWPDDNCPHTANTAFLMECRTSVSPSSVRSSILSIHSTTVSDQMEVNQHSSPLAAFFNMIARIKSTSKQEEALPQRAAVLPGAALLNNGGRNRARLNS